VSLDVSRDILFIFSDTYKRKMIKIQFKKFFLLFCLMFMSLTILFISCKSGDVGAGVISPSSEITSSELVEDSEEESSTDDTPKDKEEDKGGNDDNNGGAEEETEPDSPTEPSQPSEPSEPDKPSPPSCGDQDHELGDVIVEHTFTTERKEPDCLNEGYIKEYCSECGEVQKIEPIEALGHDKETIPGYSSTCLKHGMTDSVRCKRCEETLIESQQLPLAEHNYKYDFSCSWCDLALLKFEVAENAYAICIGPEGNARRVVIPDTVELLNSLDVPKIYPVKKIKEAAFHSHYEMYSLEIGKNVEEIGTEAFGDCKNLTEIYDKSQMRVGELPREENGGLTTDYGERKDFYYEEFESNIEIIDGCVIFHDGEEKVMIGCTNNYSDFRGTSLVIPEGVTIINGFVFTKCNYISSVTIAISVKEIKRYAFYFDCKANHTDLDHDADDCESPIDEIIMLNTKDWEISKDDIDFSWAPTSKYDIWKNLVVHYNNHWVLKI